MNAIVENKLRTNCEHFNHSTEKTNKLNSQFVEILEQIIISETETDLRINMNKLPSYEHFKIGFGGSHMWVKQLINGEPKQQVIFVRFD